MQSREYQELKQATRVPNQTDDEVLLTAQQVCARFGGISQMTLWRWLGSDVVRFPQPTMRVNKRRFWSAGSIRRWLAERSSEGLAA
jgi:predicted DNA-binding transcriptional regulator AlpA